MFITRVRKLLNLQKTAKNLKPEWLILSICWACKLWNWFEPICVWRQVKCRRLEYKQRLRHLGSSPTLLLITWTSDLTSLSFSCLIHNRRRSENHRPLSFIPAITSYKIFFVNFHWVFFFLLSHNPLKVLSFFILSYHQAWLSASGTHPKASIRWTLKTNPLLPGKEKSRCPECIWCGRHCARCVIDYVV